MDIRKCTTLYFSPTDTTRKIVTSIADGLNADITESINLNKEEIRNKQEIRIDSDIAIIGTPVYGARIPNAAQEALEKLRCRNNKTLFVLVCVYGNMSPGITLSQLYDICSSKDFNVTAMGSFIGEHSFSRKEAPVALNRPDETDLKKAEELGQAIGRKIKNADDINQISLQLNRAKRVFAHIVNKIHRIIPQRSGSIVTKVPNIDNSLCVRCGICVKNCPVGAINNDKSLSIDTDKCLRCFRCVKICPKKARKINFRIDKLMIPVFKNLGRKHKEIKTIL